MMKKLSAHYKKRIFDFKFAAGTSRGVLHQKISYYIIIEQNDIQGIGECSIIQGLSIDPMDNYELKLAEVCYQLSNEIPISDLTQFPSIAFGLETAFLDLKAKGSKRLFDNSFSQGVAGIPINGLIWMGDKVFMEKQIHEKLAANFRCLKLKVGAIDFETEIDILASIRKKFTPDKLELRLDANGAFQTTSVLEKLDFLKKFAIHSIEQPIAAKQHEAMATLCRNSPIAIALDEELIEVTDYTEKEHLLKTIKPQYIIIKPSLLGGFSKSEEWISIAKKQNIDYWVTSALESNIGLNAIAQWTASLNNPLPQGLGTGQLYTNNIPSPLAIENAKLFYNTNIKWNLNMV